MTPSQTGPRWRRIGVISITCVLVVSAVSFALFTRPPIPVSVDISKISAAARGDRYAKVRFRSLSERTYVGWFVTEAFVDGRWVESASQHREVRLEMSVGPKYRAIYQMPIPREGTEWRVRWR